MRYLVVIILLIGISCTTKIKKDSKEHNTKTVDTIPNIYVVKTIFYSKDSLPISADIYEVNEKKPTILLCHQAGYSRGEYKETAIKLNYLGYSCVAIDQRSGKEINGIKNETALKAKSKNLNTSYIDAKQDIDTAIDYVYSLNNEKPIIVIGSSYSASLALLIGKNNSKVKAIAAFSPGEYLKGINLKENIKNIEKPIFITSSKKEIKQTIELVSLINPNLVNHYKPKVSGIHGSRVLWKTTEGNKEYWKSFSNFLKLNN